MNVENIEIGAIIESKDGEVCEVLYIMELSIGEPERNASIAVTLLEGDEDFSVGGFIYIHNLHLFELKEDLYLEWDNE